MKNDNLKTENLNISAIIGSCCEIATKKRGFIYVDEECGYK
jgi:hypothetical protein